MLETIWFILWGILWAIYFVLDGFDLGLGTIMPLLAKNEVDKRVIYKALYPYWDGNEVWLITAGGVTFAAFPTTYAVMFSSFYSALMLILFALIFRAVSFEFREKVDKPAWRKLWDVFAIAGSFLPALLLGVAFANIFRGIPIDGEGIYHGNILTLLNPYGLTGGVLFLVLFCLHGSLWLIIKTEGELQKRAAAFASKLWLPLLIISVLFLLATGFATQLYQNYLKNPILFIILIFTVASLLLIRVFIKKEAWWKAWSASSGTIVGVTLFGVVGLYPNLLPSSMDPSYSLTIFNSASSPLTLKIMLGVALFFVPIVLIYQVWVYNFFKDKVKEKDLIHEEQY
jgi:cytochrome bd ubiquinol oxidase subunit II